MWSLDSRSPFTSDGLVYCFLSYTGGSGRVDEYEHFGIEMSRYLRKRTISMKTTSCHMLFVVNSRFVLLRLPSAINAAVVIQSCTFAAPFLARPFSMTACTVRQASVEVHCVKQLSNFVVSLAMLNDESSGGILYDSVT